MDWVPQLKQEENLVAESHPPPVPPKMINDWGGEDSHCDMLKVKSNDNLHEILLETAAITDVDNSLPVLPPKPKNWFVVLLACYALIYDSPIIFIM